MIELRNLALEAPDGRPLLAGLSLRIPPGGTHLLTGPSGCGKTRLLKVIAGVERPQGGGVVVGDREIWPGDGALALAGRLRVGFAFASGGLLSNLSLRDNLALPLRFLGRSVGEIRERVEAALARVGLQPVAGLRPHAVSAAARRHANLARVLALEPALVLLDDPLEGLDAEDRHLALGLVRAWAMDPACTVLIAAETSAAFADLGAACLPLAPVPSSEECP